MPDFCVVQVSVTIFYMYIWVLTERRIGMPLLNESNLESAIVTQCYSLMRCEPKYAWSLVLPFDAEEKAIVA